MTICFRSVNFFVVCFTGKSENLAETPILKDFFVADGHHFQKCYLLID